MDEDIADFAITHALQLGAKYAETRVERGLVDYYTLKNGNPEVSGFARFYGLCVRVIVNGALGFSTCFKPDNRKRVADTVNDAVRLATASSRLLKTKHLFSEERSVKYRYEVKEKIPASSIEPQDKLYALVEIEKNLPAGLQIPARYFTIRTELREKYYANSEGCRIWSRIPRIAVTGTITVLENGQTEQAILQYGKSKGWEFFEELEFSKRVNHEAESLRKTILEGKKAPDEKIDVVCGPEVVGIAVHESCGHPYEADRILGREAAQAGESFVTPAMLGKTIGNETVTVIDDPTLPNSYGYYLYDDEGVRARARYLIRNGKINEFLHNRETAARFGVKSNGSARAENYDREPIVRMGNTFMQSGDHKFEELIEDIGLGVYINSFTEWNIDDKRYHQKYVGREAYIIERGELRGRVRRPVLELTTPAFYSAIDCVGKDIERSAATCGKGEPLQGIPVDHGGPHVRLRNIRLR